MRGATSRRFSIGEPVAKRTFVQELKVHLALASVNGLSDGGKRDGCNERPRGTSRESGTKLVPLKSLARHDPRAPVAPASRRLQLLQLHACPRCAASQRSGNWRGLENTRNFLKFRHFETLEAVKLTA